MREKLDIQQYHSTFKGIPSIVLENEMIRAEWLPSYGAKLASLQLKKSKKRELLYQSPEDNLLIPEFNACFGEYDTSGFDECFPSIDECCIQVIKNGRKKILSIPDHGEVWSLAWHYIINGSKQLEFSVDSPELGYRLTKLVTLDGCDLRFDYSVDLIGEIERLPFLWTPHALFSYDESTELVIPTHLNKVKSVCDAFRLNRSDIHYDYPKTFESSLGLWNSGLFLLQDEGTCEKFYFVEKLKAGDSFGFRNKEYQVLMTVDEKVAPYLGVWKNQGAHNQTHNFALEPCSGIYDSAEGAQKNGTVAYVSKSLPKQWFLNFNLQEIP